MQQKDVATAFPPPPPPALSPNPGAPAGGLGARVSANQCFAVLLAGGSGNRMRGTVQDKCLEEFAGLPVIAHSAKAFWDSGVVGGLVVVCRDDAQRAAIETAFARLPETFSPADVLWARGGAERQDSVLNGLETLARADVRAAESRIAFIHDTARPLIHPESIRALALAAAAHGAAVLAHRVGDTIKRAPAGSAPGVPVSLEDLDRSTLWAMETPQVFRLPCILDALRRVSREHLRVTDDVAAAAHAGHAVALVESQHPNPKLTTPADLPLFAHLFASRDNATAAVSRVRENLLPAAATVPPTEAALRAAAARVKVCGITREEDARAAQELGVAYLGINAWEHSPRCVAWPEIPRLLQGIPAGKRVYVDVDPAPETLARALELGFDFAQIHFDATSPEVQARAVRWSEIAGRARLWLAPRVAADAPWPDWVASLADTLLFDGYKPGHFGGTGRVADLGRFTVLRRRFFAHRWILAGGLGPDTLPGVRAAAPDFYDLNSGIETAPGCKSAEKLRLAIAALA